MSRSKKMELTLSRFPMKFADQEGTFSKIMRNSSNFQQFVPIGLPEKKQTLPPINSPFLKKTVSNLFLMKKDRPYDIRSIQTQQKEILKEGIMSKYGNFMEISQNLSAHKNVKSFSEIKYETSSLNKKQFQQMRQSLAGKHFPKGTDSIHNIRKTTESQDHQNISSNLIFKKILKIKDEQKLFLSSSREKKTRKGKQKKPTSFAIRQKINKQLYCDEKQQIRMVKSLGKGASMDQSGMLKVKNYTQFMPKIITIFN